MHKDNTNLIQFVTQVKEQGFLLVSVFLENCSAEGKNQQ